MESKGKRGQKGIVEIGKYKLIPEDQVPGKVRPSVRWLQFFHSIPKGQAMEATKQELGIGSVYVRYLIDKLKKLELLEGAYYVTTRTRGGTEIIYIVHSSKDEE